MKLFINPRIILALAAVLILPVAGLAGTYTKVDNTNSLDQAVSWGGTAPGSGDIANWAGAYSGGLVTGSTTAYTNSLTAILPAAALSWDGISVGTISGTALTTNSIYAGVTNLSAASETVVNGFNLVTITTKANHGFEPGQSVTISGVTPSGYDGTYLVAGVPAATQFTYTNATGSLGAATAFGTVQSALYIGGAGAALATSTLTIGTNGINLSGANVSVVINDTTNMFNGNQQWQVAAGSVLRFSDGGVSGATTRVLSSGNDGLIEISGGGIVSLNEGGGSAFADANSFAAFNGSWQVDTNATLRGLRSGGDAFGTGGITLNGGTLSDGGISGDVGGWTWNNSINLNPGTTNYLAEQMDTGTGRYLQLSGSLGGSGNLVFTEPLAGATTFTSPDGGFTLCGNESGLSGGIIVIGGPNENGVAGRQSYVRVGGATPTSSTQVGSGPNGSLGADNVINNGWLTFTLSSSLSVPNQISGTGTLRIGTLTSSATYVADVNQAITLLATNTYTGPTVINAGTLLIGATGSISNSSSITIATNSVDGGGNVNTFDVSQLPNGFTTSPGQTLALNGGQLNGNFTFGPGSTNILAPGGTNAVGTLNINGNLALAGGTNTLVFDINNSANDQVSINGNLTAAGVTTLQFTAPGTGLNAGTYTLINVSGTLTATAANFSIAGLASGYRPQTFSIVINGNSIQLVVVGSPGNLTWVGDGVNNLWNVETTTNWFNNVTSEKDVFVPNDVVTFDDSGSATPAVNLTTPLAPGSVTFNNNNNNYTFSGAGQITGATGLALDGSGQLTLLTSNSFTGGVALNAGTLLITNEAALGEPTNPMVNSLILNGGTLLVTNTFTLGANTNRGIMVGPNPATLLLTNGVTLAVPNVISDTNGSGVLTETGTGTLVLDGTNNYGGGTVINGGTVLCGSSYALGLSGSWSPGFTLMAGTVDIAGQGNYVNASIGVSNNFLFNGTFITFQGNPGATMVLTDSVPGSAGFGVNGTASVNDVITYNGANNPGRAIISAPWYAVGTGSTIRTCVVEVDPSSATPVGVEFQGQLSSLYYEGKVAIIQKTGAGVMEISSTNYYPNLQVSEGTLLVNNLYALGTDRSPNYNGVGTGSPHQLIVDGGTVDLNGFSPAIGALSDNGGVTSGLILNNGITASTLTLGYSVSNEVNNASYAGTIANGSTPVALVKIGTNTQVLAGSDTYSGPTFVENGNLVINGEIGLGTTGSTVTVSSGILGGAGVINAPVIIQANGTLAPAVGVASTVPLTVTTNLTLAGTTVMNVDEDTATSDLVTLTGGTLNYGGTLVVSTNLMQSTTLASGDSFQLFSAPAYTGNFSSISGSPGPGLAWSFNPATGVLSVVGYVPQPVITGITVSGNSLVIAGTNGQAGEQYNVLTTTNLALPLSQWTMLPTNTLSGANFSITNSINPALPQSFYLLQVP